MTGEPTEPTNTSHEISLNTDDLLIQPERLSELLTSPEDFAARLHAEQDGEGEVPEALYAELQTLRGQSMRDIIAPEGKALAVGIEARNLASQAEETLALVRMRADNTTNTLDLIPRTISEVEELLPSANRAVHEIQDAIQGGRVNPDDISYLTHSLRGFSETYARALLRSHNHKEEASSDARLVASVSTEAAEEGIRALRNIGTIEHQAESEPASMYTQESIGHVYNRGSTTVAEHTAACEREVREADTFTHAIRDKFEGVAETASTLSAQLSRNGALEAMPVPVQIDDLVDRLNRHLYQMAEHGPEMSRLVHEVLGELEYTLRQVKDGVQKVGSEVQQQKALAEDIEDNSNRIRSAVIEFAG